MARRNAITDVDGIKVGHHTDRDAATGCTVVLCESGAVGGVDVRGSSPGTRETDLLRPTTRPTGMHAVLLSGGSLFGLDAASGVVRYLEERGVGIVFGGTTLPIVAAAILFDLGVVTDRVRPGPEDGYAACEAANSGAVPQGSEGAGTGATVAKLLGVASSVKAGIGSASVDLGQGVTVGAIVAVNAIGGVHDPDTGRLLAGPRSDTGAMLDPMMLITSPGFASARPTMANTTIGVVATNARLSQEHANKLASSAHDGLALAVRPAHLMGDGDTMFAMATGTRGGPVDLDRVLAAGVIAVARSIRGAVLEATGLGGIPSVSELEAYGAS